MKQRYEVRMKDDRTGREVPGTQEIVLAISEADARLRYRDARTLSGKPCWGMTVVSRLA